MCGRCVRPTNLLSSKSFTRASNQPRPRASPSSLAPAIICMPTQMPSAGLRCTWTNSSSVARMPDASRRAIAQSKAPTPGRMTWLALASSSALRASVAGMSSRL